MKKKVAVVFDLDGTLLSRNSSFLFGKFLFKRKVFTLKETSVLLSHYLCHTFFGVSSELLHRQVFAKIFWRRDVSTFQVLLPEFLDTLIPQRLYLPVWERFSSAQKAGYRVIILSCSPQFLVEAVAARLQADAGVGTTYQVSEGHFDRVSRVMDGHHKAAFVKEKLLPHYDVVVYSDSYADRPLLEVATRAVVVRPKGRLRALSRQKRWETVE